MKLFKKIKNRPASPQEAVVLPPPGGAGPPGISEDRLARALRRRREQLDAVIRANVVRPAGENSPHVRAELASQYIASAYAEVSSVLIREARQYPSAQWLAYLRQLPDWVFKEPDNAYRSDFARNLIEVITNIGGRDDAPPPTSPYYDQTETQLDSVLQLVAGVRYLADIDRLLRCVNKGVACEFVEGRELPRYLPTADQSTALEYYWDRYSRIDRFLARAGTKAGVLVPPDSPKAILTVTRIEPRAFRLPAHLETALGISEILQRHAPAFHDMSAVEILSANLKAQGTTWPSSAYWALLVFLRVMVDIVPAPPLLTTMLQQGFSSIDYDWLLELLDAQIEQAAADVLPAHLDDRGFVLSGLGVCDSVRALPASLRPLRTGGVLRVNGNYALIDLVAAAAALDHLTDFPRTTGDIANTRARAFEIVVQSTIDSTEWSPAVTIRALRGRTLRLHGQSLTDVDAVAAKNGVLLLVSVKSQVFVPEHDAGEYAAVRNSATMVTEACTAAAVLKALIDQHPVGDNYDFSGFSQRAVVVCTPYVVYVPIGVAMTEVLPGLRATVALTELEEFLTPAKSAPQGAGVGHVPPT